MLKIFSNFNSSKFYKPMSTRVKTIVFNYKIKIYLDSLKT